MLKVLALFINIQISYSWSLNPYCLFKNCDNTNANSNLISSKYIPYCYFYECDDYYESSCLYNYNCFNNKRNTFKEFWTVNYWTNEEDNRSTYERFKCIFAQCDKEKKQSYMHNFLDGVKNYLNAAKPQDIIIDNLFTSELNPLCWVKECCNDNSIPGDTKKLAELIKNKVYGQHLSHIIVDAISSHWNNNQLSKKALVLSFHGAVGTGKNYVCEKIVESLFKLGANSKFVHYFSGRLHFTDQDNYKENLYHWLKGNVTLCGKQLFIFDEADFMPHQVLNAIMPMLDYRERVDGADYRKSIFIFLSNAGSDLILHKLEGLYNGGKNRDEVVVGDFEKEIVTGIFNQKGGFYHSDTISYNLIDHYVPFLPMEEKQVVECIRDQFKERSSDGVQELKDNHIQEILESIKWKESGKLKYAATGCKNIPTKVSYFYEKYYKKVANSKEKVDL